MNIAVQYGKTGAAGMIENVTFDEIRIGQSAGLSRCLTSSDIDLFATVSGDFNPAHFHKDAAQDGLLQKVIGHGMWSASLISGVLGTQLPGPGTVYRGQDLKFNKPVELGDVVTATVTVIDKNPDGNLVTFDCVCTNGDGDKVVTGTAVVTAPTKKASLEAPDMPRVQLIRHDGHEDLMAKCAEIDPVPVAVVHPCDESSLKGAVEAAEAGLIDPILVGPANKIRHLADTLRINIEDYRIIDTPHSHKAAEIGVALARNGEADALMKGSLHTDELMSEVVRKDIGLRTSSRISHVFIMMVPTYPRPLLITDAAINIYPSLEDKMYIVQNAIDLAKVLGVETPRVAILSAVETVNPKIQSTIEAAALCKMADRGQIKGGILDGPLAFDNAISAEAARTKGIKSDVSGKADIFLVPDLEAGNMLAKQLTFLANADAAGIVLGARVPIILTSRADNVRTRLASCAVGALVAAARRKAALSVAAE
jgi:phosphate acetyltransferase